MKLLHPLPTTNTCTTSSSSRHSSSHQQQITRRKPQGMGRYGDESDSSSEDATGHFEDLSKKPAATTSPKKRNETVSGATSVESSKGWSEGKESSSSGNGESLSGSSDSSELEKSESESAEAGDNEHDSQEDSEEEDHDEESGSSVSLDKLGDVTTPQLLALGSFLVETPPGAKKKAVAMGGIGGIGPGIGVEDEESSEESPDYAKGTYGIPNASLWNIPSAVVPGDDEEEVESATILAEEEQDWGGASEEKSDASGNKHKADPKKRIFRRWSKDKLQPVDTTSDPKDDNIDENQAKKQAKAKSSWFGRKGSDREEKEEIQEPGKRRKSVSSKTQQQPRNIKNKAANNVDDSMGEINWGTGDPFGGESGSELQFPNNTTQPIDNEQLTQDEFDDTSESGEGGDGDNDEDEDEDDDDDDDDEEDDDEDEDEDEEGDEDDDDDEDEDNEDEGDDDDDDEEEESKPEESGGNEENEETETSGNAAEAFSNEYDEEQGLTKRVSADGSGSGSGSEPRTHMSCAVVCCLMFIFSILIVGATLATSFYGTTWAINKSGLETTPVVPPNLAPSLSPATSKPPTPTNATQGPTVLPALIPDAVVNCPEGNVPIEFVIIFDSTPGDVGIFLRDKSRSFLWNFGTGAFRSFTQLLRENYFIVCLSPQLEYQVEITDATGDGLASTFVGQAVYGSFRLNYQNQLVTNYSGDCSLDGYKECGDFCSCTYTLFENFTDITGQCTTNCSNSTETPPPAPVNASAL